MKTFEMFIFENNKNEKEFKDYFDKRLSAAQKTSEQSKEKGGLSLLSYYHFSAKVKQYKAVQKAIKEGKDKNYFMKKYKEILNEMKDLNITQRKFQSLSGELEVWGESIIYLF
jgi:hypothetical protein